MSNRIIFTIPYLIRNKIYKYINITEMDIKHLTSYSNKIIKKVEYYPLIGTSNIHWQYTISYEGAKFLNEWLMNGNKFDSETINNFVGYMLSLTDNDVKIIHEISNEWEINELKLIYTNYRNRLKMIHQTNYNI